MSSLEEGKDGSTRSPPEVEGEKHIDMSKQDEISQEKKTRPQREASLKDYLVSKY